MKLGIIGSGNMGRTLGMLWSTKGHDVFFGARNEKDVDYIRSLTMTDIQSGSLKEAVGHGEVLLYSLRDTMPSAVCAPSAYAGKVLIDINNGEIPDDFHYAPRTLSYAEQYQQDIPEAHVVKAFNTMAQEVYYLPTKVLQTCNIFSPFSTDSDEARAAVTELITDLGLVPLDCGTIPQSAKLLESFADLTRLLIINKGLGGTLGFTYEILPEPAQADYGVRQVTNYK